jgi:formylglycine-generating enzyme required for sulfatase activity
MDRCAYRRALVLAFGVSAAVQQARAVTIDTVAVMNPGNAGDVQSQGVFGVVAYPYRLGKTEVTNAQYADFLNAVAAADPYSLYSTDMGSSSQGGIVRSGSPGSYAYAVKANAAGQGPGGSDYAYADKPVIFVSWYDSIRFANWLHNGQGGGDTENGAYTLLGGAPTPANGLSITRNPGAKWFLPSEDEWYKGAYYSGGGAVYYDYPTGTDAAPNNNLPTADTGNSANFFDGNYTTGKQGYPLTDAGSYKLSPSHYNTFDQGGNVVEGNEALISGSLRGHRGGVWFDHVGILAASVRDSGVPTDEDIGIGFRVASIPEPRALVLVAIIAGAGIFGWRRAMFHFAI